jgi:hypothetical protein
MRWTTLATAVTLGFMIWPDAGEAQPPGNIPSAAQSRRIIEERDHMTNATFTSTTDADGNARLTIRAGEFLFEKVLAASGDATLRLSQGKDVVSIAMTGTGYVVSRGRRTARFDPRSDQAEGRNAVRTVLLGSQAVRTFRRLAAALESRDEADEEGPLQISALVDGALVQMLDGDTAATERIGKRIVRKHREAMRAAALKPNEYFRDCVLIYELALIDAWDLFSHCLQTARNSPWWISEWSETFCEFEWLARSQQYVWQFASCLALPFF